MALSLAGAESARTHGLERAFGIFLRLNASESLRKLGRWDESEEQLREVEGLAPIGIDVWRIAEERCFLAIGRGDFERARSEAAQIENLLGSASTLTEKSRQIIIENVHVAIAAWSGDEVGGLERRRRRHRNLRRRPGAGLRHHRQRSGRGRHRGAAGNRHRKPRRRTSAGCDELAGRLEEGMADSSWSGGPPAAFTALQKLFAAEVARAAGTDRGDDWLVVAQAWESYGMRPRVAYAQWRAAEAFVRADDRESAQTSVRSAYALAQAIGWVGARDTLASLARRARLDLGTTSATTLSPADRFGLTARELDVVALLAEGRTNRQIADVLFISAKTASVHVSNILAKLGVSNRGEAAAAARRFGLDGTPAGS